MAQGYYTLEEAAHILHMAPDDLKQIARKGEIRSFQDRGTWRFRQQDIQEMARQRGLGSDPELVLGEAQRPKAGDSGGPKSPKPGDSSPKSPGRGARPSEFVIGEAPPAKSGNSPSP